jgi:hypothetical protein
LVVSRPWIEARSGTLPRAPVGSVSSRPSLLLVQLTVAVGDAA